VPPPHGVPRRRSCGRSDVRHPRCVSFTRHDLVRALVTTLAFAGCAERTETTLAPERSEEIAAPVGKHEGANEAPAELPTSTREDGPPRAEQPPPATAASLVGPLVGRYRFVGGQAQRAGIARAVEDVVARMGVLSRGIARKRLLAASEIPSTIEIAADGDLVTVAIDGRRHVARLGGKSVRVRGRDGKRSHMRYRMHERSLVQVFDASEGDRINTFSPREGGGITLHVTIRSPKLPADVRYRLSYRRAGPAPAA